ncbi:MAG: hypothetical protein L0Y66_23005 [Myxococcaceae bacterium]|nr:hypothetical protein [Myxococcaceae bacterium]MCI0673876.1 hypothetical protein [Myxococcaceae bacterium]
MRTPGEGSALTTLLFAACLAPVMTSSSAAAAPARSELRTVVSSAHPLDPLSREEIAAAAKVVRSSPGFPEGALFPVLSLEEPPKEEVLAFRPGAPSSRQALAVVLDRVQNRTFEVRVGLRERKVVSWRESPAPSRSSSSRSTRRSAGS